VNRAGAGVRPLLVAFALSGCAGLIYEVAWARALSQAMGQSLQAMTAVLVVFLLGLGTGALAGGRLAPRLRRPLLAYAGLEAAIALFGLLSPPVLRLVPVAMEALGPGIPDGAPFALLRLLVAAAVLGPATVAMGATLPCLVQASRGRAAAEPAIGLLYGWNTIGAAGGAALGSFLLMPFAGTRGALAIAAAANLIAGTIAWRLGRRWTAREAVVPPQPAAGIDGAIDPGGASAPPGVPIVLAVAFLSGAIGALFQIGWTRVIAMTFGSSVYALGLTLTACILGLGVGPVVAARPAIVARFGPARRAAAALWLQGALSFALLPAFALLPSIASQFSSRLAARPGVLVGLLFLCLAALLCPATMAQGAAFSPLAILAGDLRGRAAGAAGRTFAASSCGSAIGFLLAGFAAIPALGTRPTLALAAAASIFLALVMLRTGRPPSPVGERGGRRFGPAWALLAGAPALFLLVPAWDRLQMSGGPFLYGPVYHAALGAEGLAEAIRRRGDLLFYREDGAGVVTVRRSPAGVLSMQINGRTEASGGGDLATQILAADLPLLLHPDPRNVLLVGLASGISLGAAARHPVESVRVVEIVPSVVDGARLFADDNGGALDDPRVEIAIDDARSHLLARPERYDVIASQPSNPWVSGVANLFTVEFYRLARRRLRPGGLFAQWVQGYRLEPVDLRGIARSFIEVFPDATLWEESAGGGDFFLVGGDGPIVVDPVRYGAVPDGVRVDLARAGVGSAAALASRFVCGPDGLRAFAGGAPLHTDDDLYLEWRAPLALFRDTLAAQTGAINRFREPVHALLPASPAARDPRFVADLAEQLRLRAGRLAIAASLKDADRMALVDPHLAAGIDRLRRGQYEAAVAALATAVTEQPASPSAHFLLGEGYRGMGLCRPAVVAFREAVRQDAGLAAAWHGIGRCLLRESDLDDAERALREAIRLDPLDAAARNNLGTVRLRAGDLDAAERLFRDALGADPGLSAAHANLGLVLARRGDPAAARDAYRAALDLDPLNLDALYNLAAALKATGDAAGAAVALRRLLSVDPGDGEAGALLRSLEEEAPRAAR
jgi:spermidine synthase